MPIDWPWRLPLDDIKSYFGEQIGFYFGFLGHLTTGTLIFAPIGIACQVCGVYKQGQREFLCFFVFDN